MRLRFDVFAMIGCGVLVCSANAQPIISQQPTNAMFTIGQSAGVSVAVSGGGPFGYQWFKDGVRLPGQTNQTLGFASFQFTNCGSYSVAVTNAAGMAISLPAFLSVPHMPVLVTWGYNLYGQLGNGETIDYYPPVSLTSNVVAAAGGVYHSLFLNFDGSLWAMGRNNLGQLGIGTTNDQFLPVPVANDVVAVAGGDSHSLFVKTDGTLWAMGYNYWGQLGIGTSGTFEPNPTPVVVASNVVAMAGGGGHTLILKNDGTLWGVGVNDTGQLANGNTSDQTSPIIMASNVVAVAAGGGFSLFRTADNVLWAVGSNIYGQLGNGTTTSTNVPVAVASNVVAMAAGGSHSLYVTGDGVLWTMGRHSYGQLGNGLDASFGPNAVPTAVASNVIAVAAGYYHSLFVKGDGSLWTMGRNTDGQLGDGSTVHSTNRPVRVPGMMVASLGGRGMVFHSLAVGLLSPQISDLENVILSPGQPFDFNPMIAGSGPFAFQWQFNGTNIAGATNRVHSVSSAGHEHDGAFTLLVNGLIGTASASARVAVRVLPQVEVWRANGKVPDGASASLSVTNTVGLLSYQWFKDGVWLVGQTNHVLSFDSFQLTNSGSYRVMVASDYGIAHSRPISLSITNTLNLTSWGNNNHGQLGNGNTSNQSSPVAVADNLMAVAGGDNHSLFVKADGTLWSMGWNAADQLGNVTTATTNKPVAVASNIVAVAGGSHYSLFVNGDGSLKGYGSLGNGKNTRPLANNVVAVAGGGSHFLFVMTDGTLWAMGGNSVGQLGNGTTADTNRPVAVAGNVVAVAGGGLHSLFVKSDGTLWAMGYNGFGQLGNGNNTNNVAPVVVASNVVAVAGGLYHSLFVKSDGSLWGMGLDNYGQLGSGTFATSNLPVAVASNVVAVAAGSYHSLFAKSDGSLWTMGLNNYGQLGNGKTVNTNAPVQVAGFTVASLGGMSSAYHSLAAGLVKPWISGLANTNILAAQAFVLNPVIGGSGPLSYQWQLNGVNIVGATNSLIVIPNVTSSNAGVYTLVATGAAGSSSASANLSIIGLRACLKSKLWPSHQPTHGIDVSWKTQGK